MGKTVQPIAGAAAGTAVDATPADDVGASVTAFEDAAGKTLVSGTASVAGAERGFLPCSRHLLTYGFHVTVAVVVAVVALAGREGKHGTYVGSGEESHRRETIAAVAAAAAACHRRETSIAAAVAAAAAACHHRDTSIVVAAAAAEACHRRETSIVVAAAAAEACRGREASIVVAAAAAEACHRPEIPYCYPFVGLRLPRPPRPDNHDRRQEHGRAMDVPGTGGE